MPLQLDVAADAAYLLPFAKKKLRELQERLRETGAPYLAQNIPVSSGERIFIATRALSDELTLDRVRITGGAKPFAWVIAPYLTPTTDRIELVGKPGVDAHGATAFKLIKALPIQPSFDYGDSFFDLNGREWFSEGDWDRNQNDEIRMYSDFPELILVWSSVGNRGGYVIFEGENPSYIRLSSDGKSAIVVSNPDFTRIDRFVVDFSNVSPDTGNITPSVVHTVITDGSSQISEQGYTRDQKKVLWYSAEGQNAGLLPPNDIQYDQFTHHLYLQDLETLATSSTITYANVCPSDHANSVVRAFPDEAGGVWTLIFIIAFADAYTPPDPPLLARISGAGFRLYHNSTLLLDEFHSVPAPDNAANYLMQFQRNGDNFLSISEDGRIFAIFYKEPADFPSPRAILFIVRDFTTISTVLPSGAFMVDQDLAPIVWNDAVYQQYADGSGGMLVLFDGAGSYSFVELSASQVPNYIPGEAQYKLAEGKTWYSVDRIDDGMGGAVRFHQLAKNPDPPDGDGLWVHSVDSASLYRPIVDGNETGFLESLDNALLWAP